MNVSYCRWPGLPSVYKTYRSEINIVNWFDEIALNLVTRKNMSESIGKMSALYFHRQDLNIEELFGQKLNWNDERNKAVYSIMIDELLGILKDDK